jgi:hypothetical protein
MKKFYPLVLSIFIFISSVAQGQLSSREAGLRLGYRSGIFYQLSHQAGNAEIAYNGMLGFNSGGIQLTGLRIIYETSINSLSPDLYFAWGFGGHAGFMNIYHRDYYNDPYYTARRSFCPVIGIDGWLSAEYRLREIPLNISLNLKPFVEVAVPESVRFMPVDLALSVSYVF